MGKDGFDNENKIIEAINGKRFIELNNNLQSFIKDIFSFNHVCDDIISCKKEACDILKCHPNTLRKWDKKGILKAVRFGERKDRKYKKEDILKFLDEK